MAKMMRHVFYLSFSIALVTHRADAFSYPQLAVKSGGSIIGDNRSPTIGGAAHPCFRACTANDRRTCYYEFYLLTFSTMAKQCGNCPYTIADCYNPGCMHAGGDVRQVDVVNYMLPGPSIQVCEGDTIQVKIMNALGSDVATIHWHGMHQVDSPYMDGVPFLTQCPVLPGNTFVYNFTASPSGTHFWHAHSGLLETNGVHGSLIVREADDPLADRYDYDLAEHRILIHHWFPKYTDEILKSAQFRSTFTPGYSLTINGYASTAEFVKTRCGKSVTYRTPKANFTVTQGYRYRFRSIMNVAIYCPVQLSVDNHKLTVISVDGNEIEPVEVDSYVINAGERYDFVLTADQPVQNYWMRFRGLGLCSKVSQVAILFYEGAGHNDPSGTTDYDDARRSGVLLNPEAVSVTDYSNNTLITIADLNTTAANALNISGTPDHTFYVASALRSYPQFQTPGPYAQFNNISYIHPDVPPLTQYDQNTRSMFCTPDDDTAKECVDDYCICPTMYEVPINKLVEIVFVDESSRFSDNHPQHLHGQGFAVVSMVYGNMSDVNGSHTVASVKALNEAGLIEKKFENAPIKDTLGMPDQGYAVLRLNTKNPGYWFFHCHVAAHLEEGMAFVLKVGEHSEMVHPPAGFPTCSGNYDIRGPLGVRSKSRHYHAAAFPSPVVVSDHCEVNHL